MANAMPICVGGIIQQLEKTGGGGGRTAGYCSYCARSSASCLVSLPQGGALVHYTEGERTFKVLPIQ